VPEGKGRRKSLADVVSAKPLSASAESLRNLLIALRYIRPRHQGCVVALTSALPNEGKTTTAAALGRVAAMGGESVVVVDCAVRGKRQGAAGRSGWMEMLQGEARIDDVLVTDPETGVAFLPHGATRPQDVHR